MFERYKREASNNQTFFKQCSLKHSNFFSNSEASNIQTLQTI